MKGKMVDSFADLCENGKPEPITPGKTVVKSVVTLSLQSLDGRVDRFPSIVVLANADLCSYRQSSSAGKAKLGLSSISLVKSVSNNPSLLDSKL